MMKTKTTYYNTAAFAAVLSVLSVAACVALPQACHLLGLWLGLGSKVGEMLLPMHLPVMLAGFWGGPVAGLVSGLVSPVLSHALTGMPAAALLPFMTVELAGYGLCAGLLRRSSMPVMGQVLLTQLAGRAARALALLVAVYGLGYTGVPLSIIWTSLWAGAAGMLLQLVLLPVLTRVTRR